jgi:dethiobiotin synthetase
MRRLIVLGTGTGVGKTYVAERLIRALAEALPSEDVVGIKAIETGIVGDADSLAVGPAQAQAGAAGEVDSPHGHAPVAPNSSASSNARTDTGIDGAAARSGGAPPSGSDAWTLERVSRGTPIRPHPVRAFPDAVSPHLAARRTGTTLQATAIADAIALHATTIRGWQIVELAGGTFSPLSPTETNLDLALALEPSIWVVVAPDALGVLHDVRATVLAMRASAREPDYLILSAARAPDASSGTNAAELPRVGLRKPDAVLGRDDDADAALAPLITEILRIATQRG